jgi:hypothetical protein
MKFNETAIKALPERNQRTIMNLLKELEVSPERGTFVISREILDRMTPRQLRTLRLMRRVHDAMDVPVVTRGRSSIKRKESTATE